MVILVGEASITVPNDGGSSSKCDAMIVTGRAEASPLVLPSSSSLSPSPADREPVLNNGQVLTPPHFSSVVTAYAGGPSRTKIGQELPAPANSTTISNGDCYPTKHRAAPVNAWNNFNNNNNGGSGSSNHLHQSANSSSFNNASVKKLSPGPPRPALDQHEPQLQQQSRLRQQTHAMSNGNTAGDAPNPDHQHGSYDCVDGVGSSRTKPTYSGRDRSTTQSPTVSQTLRLAKDAFTMSKDTYDLDFPSVLSSPSPTVLVALQSSALPLPTNTSGQSPQVASNTPKIVPAPSDIDRSTTAVPSHLDSKPGGTFDNGTGAGTYAQKIWGANAESPAYHPTTIACDKAGDASRLDACSGDCRGVAHVKSHGAVTLDGSLNVVQGSLANRSTITGGVSEASSSNDSSLEPDSKQQECYDIPFEPPNLIESSTNPGAINSVNVDKNGNGSRKKGNKAKWVPIEINRAPFRDEFFSSYQGNYNNQTNFSGKNFSSRKDGPTSNGGGNASGAGGPTAFRKGIGQKLPNENQGASRGATFRRQNSQYSMQSRDSPVPRNVTSSPNNEEDAEVKGNHLETSSAPTTSHGSSQYDGKSDPYKRTEGSSNKGHEQHQPYHPSHDTNSIASPHNHPTTLGSASQSTAVPSINNNPRASASGSRPPRQTASANGTYKGSNGYNGSQTGGGVATRRGSNNSNRALPRINQQGTMGEGQQYVGNSYYSGNQPTHQIPIFSGIPAPGSNLFSRFQYYNAGPPNGAQILTSPAYAPGSAPHHHHHATANNYQIPLLAPYPYDNEAYYNYNTVVAHPFFTTHAPQLYYRPLTLPPPPPPPLQPTNLSSPGNAPHTQQQQLGGQRWHNSNSSSSQTSSVPKTIPAPHSHPPVNGGSSSSRSNNNNGIADSSTLTATALLQTRPSPSDSTEIDCDKREEQSASHDTNHASTTTPATAAPNDQSPEEIPPSKNHPTTMLTKDAQNDPTAKPTTTATSTHRTASHGASNSKGGVGGNPHHLPSLMTALHHHPRIMGPPPHLTPYFTGGAPPLPPPIYVDTSTPVGAGALSPPGFSPPVVVGEQPSPTGLILLATVPPPPPSSSSMVSPQFNVPLIDQMRKQIEYYFSEENLQKDIFLRKNMDSQGFIPLSLIVSFHRVKMLTSDYHLIRQAIKSSTEVEFVNERVRTKRDPLMWPLTTIYTPTMTSPVSVGPLGSNPDPVLNNSPGYQHLLKPDDIPMTHGQSNFPFPSPLVSATSAHQADLQPTSQIPSATARALTIDGDDEKLIEILLNSNGDPSVSKSSKTASGFSHKYSCKYFLRKCHSVPNIAYTRLNPFVKIEQKRPQLTPLLTNRDMSDVLIAIPTQHLTNVLRLEPKALCSLAIPISLRHDKKFSIANFVARMTDVLNHTFESSRDNDCRRAPSLETGSGPHGIPPKVKRWRSYPTLIGSSPLAFTPTVRMTDNPFWSYCCIDKPPRLTSHAWYLSNLAHHLQAFVASQNPTTTNLAPKLTASTSKFDTYRPQGRLHNMIHLLKENGLIAVVPYNTLVKPYHGGPKTPETEVSLQTLYASWSKYLLASFDPYTLDLFRDVCFTNAAQPYAYEFGIERLLEFYRCYLTDNSSCNGEQRLECLHKIIQDLFKIYKNGKWIKETQTWLRLIMPSLTGNQRDYVTKALNPLIRHA